MRVPGTPILWTDRDTASLGASSASWSVTGVSIDTRTIVPGDLFIALRGPNFDGHHFASQAVEAGAASVVHAAVATALPSGAYVLHCREAIPSAAAANATAAKEMWAASARIVRAHGVRF